jgi:hypothetical protein
MNDPTNISNMTGLPVVTPLVPPQAVSGRGPGGRFAPGNKISKGNAVAHHAAKYRALLFANTSEDDVKAVWASIITAAKSGESWAAKLFLEYTAGPPRDEELQAKIAELENLLAAHGAA